ncbi:hemerythrin domain-containing protein [Salsipaludibacter albus]|uniref:hemerythrin domain-containing protein n=1 Tax=Salsipaludibacter albus TaxID=2849650 RepID=UPI001EE4DC75|nr:hemerythrin domain-containing protein [Salsipaludibacter albus]
MVTGHADDRVRRFGRELVEVHDELRDRLDDLRAAVRGDGPATPAGMTPRAHCLTFCRALRAHHEGEDAGMFRVLLDVDPGLADTVDKLVQDHDFIASLVVRLEALAAEWDADQVDDVAAFERELDGLGAILTSHLAWEERALVDLLDGLDLAAGSIEEQAVAQALDGVLDQPPAT